MSLDLLKVEANERLDLLDFQYLIDEFASNGLANTANLFLTNPNGSLHAWILKGFALSNLSGKQLTVTKGTAILAYRGTGAIKYGMITAAGDATKVIDMNALASNTYNVYIRFEFVDGPNSSRAFWNPEGAGSEFAQAISIKKLANWSLRVETSSPGAEWLQIGTADNSGVGLVIVDQRPLYFEGAVNTTYASGWSTDGGGGANDRNADRKTYGIQDLQTFTAAVRQCLEDLKGRGLKRWWDRDIGGMNIGFDANPTSGRLAVGDANYYVSLESGSPRITFASGDYAEYDRTNNILKYYVGNALAFEIDYAGEIVNVHGSQITNLQAPLAATQAATANYVDNVSYGTRRTNLIINSDFRFSQRMGFSSTIVLTTAKTYALDRWHAFAYSAAIPTATIARINSGLGPTNNDRYCARVQKSVGQANNATLYLSQEIDRDFVKQGQNRLYALRFRARCGANFSGASSQLFYGFTRGNSTPSDTWWKLYPTALGYTSTADNFPGVVTLTTSWQQFEFYLNANPAWVAGNIRFYYTTTGVAGANDWFDITEVQLIDASWQNVGDNSNKWELAGLNYEGELALCRKYYEKSYEADTDPGQIALKGIHITNGTPSAVLGGALYWELGAHPRFLVPKRVTPTVRLWTSGAIPPVVLGNWELPAGTNRPSIANPGLISLNGFFVGNNGGAVPGGIQGACYGHWDADAEI